MSDKLDPLKFWQQLQGTIVLHDAIFATRKKLIKKTKTQLKLRIQIKK